ncbi:hypothetical protein [Caminibacter pacificus]
MNYIFNLNNEMIDNVCSSILSARFLYENNNEGMFLYSYLLLQATGIERLQKIAIVLNILSKTKFLDYKTIELKLKELGHKIDKIHKVYFARYFDDKEKIYYEFGIDLLSEIINVKNGYRYINFYFENSISFIIQAHITEILKIKFCDGFFYDGRNIIDLSLNILDLILKKYVAILVDLIRRKEIGNGEIAMIPCLLKLSSEEFLFLDLNHEIENIIVKYKNI